MSRFTKPLLLALGVAVPIPFGLSLAALKALSARSKASRPKLSAPVLERASTPAAPPPQPSDSAALQLTWTGVAGVRLEVDDGEGRRTLLIDPYLTRHSIPEFVEPIDSDDAALERAFPAADVIFVAHSHHDHLGDVPSIAIRTGAVVYGSRTTCALARAMGVPDAQLVEIRDGQRFQVGPFDVEVIEHEHGHSALGVPFAGEVHHRKMGRPWLWEMKMGGAFAFVVRAAGRTIYHQSTAGLTDSQLRRLDGLQPDLACICLALRQNTRKFEERLFAALQPARVMPIHHDDFFGKCLADEVPLLPGVDVAGFSRKVAEIVGEGTEIVPSPFVAYDVVPVPAGELKKGA